MSVSPTCVSIGREIRRRRLARGLTQLQLANTVGVTESYISMLESGQRWAGLRVLAQIAYTLGARLTLVFRDRR